MRATYATAQGTRSVDFEDCFALVCGTSIVRFRDDQALAKDLFDFLSVPKTAAQVAGGVPGIRDPERLLQSFVSTGVVLSSSPLVGELTQLPPRGNDAEHKLIFDMPDDLVAEPNSDEFIDSTDSAQTPVVIVRYSVQQMLEISRKYWSAGICHIPLLPFDGEKIIVGPAVVPGLTACFECLLAGRAAITDWPEEYLHPSTVSQRQLFTDRDLQLGLNLAKRLAQSAFFEQNGELIGACSVFSPLSLTMYSSRVWSVPRCPTRSRSGMFSTNYPWLRSPS